MVGVPEFVLPALVGGLALDGLVRWHGGGAFGGPALRAAGALFPILFVTTYFGLAATTFRLTWVVHVWTGTTVTAGLAGLLLTYAMEAGAHVQ